MITKKNCIDYILQKVPEFQNSWEDHLTYWKGEEPGICNDVSSFSHFTIDKIGYDNQELLSRIFSVAEELLVDGDEEVVTSVSTCFLENLLNSVSAETISSLDFVGFLGKNSRTYCRKWDNFTGVRTVGL